MAEPFTTLAADVPIVLLPVRVETRWFMTESQDELELWIRVFPDEIHLAPALGATAIEREQVARYWQTRTVDGEDAMTTRAAWARLVELYGDGRAAWLVRVLAAAPMTLSDAEHAELRVSAMPDRWHVVLRGPSFRLVATSDPVAQDLAAAPIVGDDKGSESQPALGKALAWVTHFPAAQEVGMAMKIRVPKANAEALDELLVLGVREGDPNAGADTLGSLVARQAASVGASLVSWGTPTNRLAETTEESARTRGEPGPWSGGNRVLAPIGPTPKGDAARLVTALGIDGALAQDLVSDGIDRGAIARAMHEVLWPATWGYYLEKLANRPPEQIGRARELFLEHVRPLGPLPAVRVRAQPYGVLPATTLDGWNAAAAHGACAAFLNRMRESWRPTEARVPRLVGSTDVDRDLVAIMRRGPAAIAAWLRGAVDRDTAVVSGGGDWTSGINALRDAMEAMNRALEPMLLGIDGAMHVTALVFEDQLHRVTIPFVAPPAAPLDAPLPHDYLAALSAATDLTAEVDGSQPRTLLYLLARHAAQLVASAVSPVHPDIDGALPTTAIARTTWHAHVASLFHHVIRSPGVVAHRAALRSLAGVTVRELTNAFSGCLDSASHRVDAWITALATERLAEIRMVQPRASYVGGWAWLERPRPNPHEHVDLAFVHAPSVEQARSAGVLRAAYEAHRQDDQGASLAIDLSADRVRSARWFLDGVRAGRPISRLLGDRIEQWLVDGHHDTLLRTLRADSVLPGQPLPDLVDGWKLYHSWSVQRPTDAVLKDIADHLFEVVDSVADLLFSDGVYHAVAGNLARAGASLDALERGELATPDPYVARTAVDGPMTRWRCVLALPVQAGWSGPATPRAAAEPRLDAFAAQVLGSPDRVELRVEIERDGARTHVTRSLADLGLSALDVVIHAGSGDDRMLRELAGASAAGADGRIVSIEGSSELDVVVMKAAALARLYRTARTPVAGDLGALRIDPPGARSDDEAAILGELATPAATGSLGSLSDVASTTGELALWISDLGRARPALEPLDLLLLAEPEALGGKRVRTSDGIELLVFGSAVDGSQLLLVDGWTELAPAKEVSSGAAFPYDAPRAQPPQSILVAVTPPQGAWSLSTLEAIVRETVDLARSRVIAPEDVHGQLGPALFVADDPDELTPTFDPTHVIVTEAFEVLQP